jgi:hypothetical protein
VQPDTVPADGAEPAGIVGVQAADLDRRAGNPFIGQRLGIDLVDGYIQRALRA